MSGLHPWVSGECASILAGGALWQSKERRFATAFCVGAALFSTNAAAESQATDDGCADGGTIGFRGVTVRLENDLFTNTGSNYTNGVSLTAVSQDLPGEIDSRCLPAPVRLHAALIDRLDPEFWRDGGDVARAQNVAVKFGQSMYTPGDPGRTDLIADDRPYAGLLYVGLSWNRRKLDPEAGIEKLDTRELTLGVIGPLSLARGSLRIRVRAMPSARSR